MPENGIKYMNRKDLLSFEEMTRLIRVFGDLGVSKIRITGGEPFVRKGIMSFLKGISELETIKEINITTNGTFTVEQIPALEKMGPLPIALWKSCTGITIATLSWHRSILRSRVVYVD